MEFINQHSHHWGHHPVGPYFYIFFWVVGWRLWRCPSLCWSVAPLSLTPCSPSTRMISPSNSLGHWVELFSRGASSAASQHPKSLSDTHTHNVDPRGLFSGKLVWLMRWCLWQYLGCKIWTNSRRFQRPIIVDISWDDKSQVVFTTYHTSQPT